MSPSRPDGSSAATENALNESGELFRSVINAMAEGVVVQRADGTIASVNRAAEQIQGRTAEEMVGLTWEDRDWGVAVRENGTPFPVADQPALVTLRTGLPQHDVIMGISRPDGERRWISINCEPLIAAGDIRPYAVVSTFHDITAQKWAEERIRKLGRLYATLSQINQVIVRAADRATLFAGLCKAAVEQGKFVMAWVGLVDEATGLIEPVCHDGHEAGYLSEIAATVRDEPWGQGPLGASIRSNRVEYLTDVATDPQAEPFRESALARGFRAAASLPFCLGERVIGALALYAAETEFFDDEQRALLKEMSDDISFALGSLESRARREKAEAELREREAELVRNQLHLARAQRLGKIGSMEEDPATKTWRWSAEMYELLDLDPATTIPGFETFLASIHPDDRNILLERRSKTTSGVATQPAEYRFVRRDGEVRWGHGQTEIIRGEDGELRMISTFQDVTERKRNELNERKSREHLARAQRLGAIGSADVDLVTGEVYWSDELYRLIGADRETTQPGVEALAEATVPEDQPLVRKLAERMRRGEEVPHAEVRVRLPDGTIRWLRRQHEFTRNATGMPLSAVITFQDITERKTMEDSLRSSSEYLALAQKVGHIGSATVDSATGTIGWSDEMYAIMGLDPATTAAHPEAYYAAVHPDDRAAARARGARVLRGEDAEPAEFRVVRPNGEIRWVYLQTHLISGADRERARSITIMLDITDRKQREDALRRSRTHLARAQQVGGIGSAEVDFRSGSVQWSDELYTLFGLDKAVPASFDTFLSVLAPDSRRLAQEVRERELRGEVAGPYEVQIIRPDGERRWLYRQVEIIRGDDFTSLGLIATYLDITERKRTEAELRERERRLLLQYRLLATAQSQGKIGSAEVDLRTFKLQWSDEFFRLFGFDPATTSPSVDLFLSAIHPEDRDRMRETVARNRAGEDLGPSEYRVVHADGSISWHYRAVEFIRDERGIAHTLLTTSQDITDRKQVELELRLSREHLARAQRVGRVGSVEVDIRSEKALWSDELYDLIGLEPNGDTSFERFLSAVHPLDRPEVLSDSDAVLRGEPLPPRELRFLHRDGSVRWTYRQAEVVRDAAGRPIASVATFVDITERKQAELELRRSEERLRASRENLALAQKVGHVGSAVIDVATGTVEWSDETFAILGLDPAITRASPELFFAAVHPDEREEARRRWHDRILRGFDAGPVERRIVRPDGEVRWVVIQTDVVRETGGRGTKAVSNLQDITERKRAQQERDEFERQLMQSQKMEAMGKLTGGVAHDFNNLLSVILGRLALVEDELEDRPELRDSLRICMNAANRGVTLTRSMLAFSRQQTLRPVVVDVAAVIADVMTLLPRTLGETIEVKGEVAADLWRCLADPGQLQNALLNLALNARDAMPEGGRLAIGAENMTLGPSQQSRELELAPGDYVVLSVSDTGTGMPTDVVERAFDPFFTTKEAGKGTGLGLSMVYGFAKQSGGQAKIFSEVGRGTTVRLYLPRGQAQSAATGGSARKVLPGGAETILLVEDDEDVRDMTIAMLKKLGYAVLAASDGPQALDLFARNPEIALLLSDVTLPGGLSGPALASRAAQSKPGTKVIFMSGYTTEDLSRDGDAGSQFPLLHKPFGIDQLARLLRDALGR